MADELQDYVAVMACLWLPPPKRPSFVKGRMGRMKKESAWGTISALSIFRLLLFLGYPAGAFAEEKALVGHL